MEESYDEMVKRSYEWYRKSFPNWADSDCLNMAIRDVNKQLDEEEWDYANRFYVSQGY